MTENVATIVNNFVAGDISREEMVAALGEVEYEYGKFHSYDGYEPGTTDAIVELLLDGTLTSDEVTTIVLRHEERGVGRAWTNGD